LGVAVPGSVTGDTPTQTADKIVAAKAFILAGATAVAAGLTNISAAAGVLTVTHTAGITGNGTGDVGALAASATSSQVTFTAGVQTTQGVAGVAAKAEDKGAHGVATGDVDITDANAASTTAAGTITSVSLSQYGAATINSGALNTITLAGVGTSVAETAGALTTATSKTLTLNLNDADTTGAVTLDSDHTTVNIVSNGASATGKNDLAGFTASGATAINISGTSKVELTQTIKSNVVITDTGTGGVTLTNVLDKDTTFVGGVGGDTITLADGTGTKAITTGGGNDTIKFNGVFGTGGSLDAGEGTDTIEMSDTQAVTALGTATFASKVAGLEVLKLDSAVSANSTFDMTKADGINSVTTTGATGGTLTITNASAAFTLTQTALNTQAQSIALGNPTGSADVVNLVFAGADGYSNGANVTTITGVETLNITTLDASTNPLAGGAPPTTPFVSQITAANASTVNISGNVGFNATGMTQTTLTTFDASGVTATGVAGAVTLTTGNLTGSATLTGGAGTNVIDGSATLGTGVTANLTITGGSGTDTLTGGGDADTISGGNGTNTLSGNGGADTITGGANSDLIDGGADADTIDGGAGVDRITGGTGADTITSGTGGDTIVVGTGESIRNNMDIITDLTVNGTGADTIDLPGATAAVPDNPINVSLASSILEALDLATAGNATQTQWFQFGGNTYLIDDVGAGATFDDATDTVIQITGLVSLGGATITNLSVI